LKALGWPAILIISIAVPIQNRIISFVCTQWRPLNTAFSQEPFDHFEAFVQSFKFLKKDFYEEIEEKIRELKG
jgi:hypothetical protein